VFSVLRTTERKCEEKGLNYYENENDVSILDQRDEEEEGRTTETPREERERER
jgi:hypothetical protein